MSMVDENDPFKGLETTKAKRKRKHYYRWLLNNFMFIVITICTVVAGVQQRYEEMRFLILVLFFMLVIDYVRDILNEIKALRKQVEANRSSLTQNWSNVKSDTFNKMWGESNRDDT